MKTIITTNLPYHTAAFQMEYSLVDSSYLPLCSYSSGSTPACIPGSNDFSGATDSSSYSIKFLKITFVKAYWIGLCEVWTSSFKNYAPLSTITYSYATNSGSPDLKYKSYDRTFNYGLSFYSTGKFLGSQN